MGRQPRPRSANPTSETTANRSLNEWVVLALLVEEPTHGFAAAKALAAGGDLGRILTVRRPLVYRALDRLADAGWIFFEPSVDGDLRLFDAVEPFGV